MGAEANDEQVARSYVQHVMEQKNELERREYQASLEKIRDVHRRVREAADDYTDLTLQVLEAEQDSKAE
jgi:hypothetical protein